jgi:hypothetical protein
VILNQLTEGVVVHPAIPWISFHFDQMGIVYAAMNPLYQETIAGHVIAFLDSFLKGLVNGGFLENISLSICMATEDRLIRHI